MVELINADGIVPNGHYNGAIAAGGLVFTSILLPGEADRQSSNMTVEQQMAAVLSRLARTLEIAGSNLGNIVRATIYVTDIADWDIANRAYSAAMKAYRPARGVIAVRELRHGWAVAMDAIAIKPGMA